MLCTFELLTTFGQIIHPFQNFRIGSLVTMWRLKVKKKGKNKRGGIDGSTIKQIKTYPYTVC